LLSKKRHLERREESDVHAAGAHRLDLRRVARHDRHVDSRPVAFSSAALIALPFVEIVAAASTA